MITSKDLEPTLNTLTGIINSAAHPDVAIRVVMVELKPIRKELTRLQTIVDKLKLEEKEINL